MTTIDVSTGPRNQDAPPPDHGFSADSAVSTLDQLREVGNNQVEFAPFVFENPLRLARFTCRTDVPSREYTAWQRAALPANKGRTGLPDVTKMDQFRLYARAIADTCEQVEIRRAATEDYRVVTDAQGQPLTFADTAFLAELGTPDKLVAVLRLMGKSEPYLINRGQELLEKAGYGEEDADDDNPLG